MKIIFMGTPDFAVRSLKRIYNDGHEIMCVITQEDKPGNRGMKTIFNPVKDFASSHDITVLQPATLKDEKTIESIRRSNCDLIVVVAYGKFLPKEILDIPPLGCINIHGSLLPKYRGASPIQHAVLNGEKETGVTSQFISERMDAGDIIFTEKTHIGDDETSGDLFIRLSLMGAELLSKTINALSQNTAVRIPQNDDEATYAPLLTKEMTMIDWNKKAFEIKCKVRALNPRPAAKMEFCNKILKVFSVDITQNKTNLTPGSIISSEKPGLEIACSDGTVLLNEIQSPGGKRMHASEFIKGFRG